MARIFDHDFLWNAMVDNYSGGEAWEGVARLMSAVGIAVNMDY